ncbi:G-protein coupled receptor GRL101-like [Littorina saxatilis]|uniref:G-protein coupled receptor GRL101-like n=1 Tax=Littorina saxatilis TaxID=31220 RepID=UPI0038B5AEFC
MQADFVLPGKPNCAILRVERRPGILYMDSCQEKVIGDVLCEVRSSSDLRVEISTPEKMASTRKGYVDCQRGHVTHDFLSCDYRSDCWDSDHETCSEAMSMYRSFRCKSVAEWLPFPLVCDHREDCRDGSDENFCVFPACPEFTCDNKQCIPHSKRCDAVENCVDNSDEMTCSHTFVNFTLISMTTPLPAIALLDGKGHYNLFEVDAGLAHSIDLLCPETHFPCPGVRYYCLPVYVRCNGVYDCPGHEDEASCHSVTCPGFYRCRGSKLCLHDNHVCDGVYQCPERDDELLCGFECPLGCTCYGLAFHCTGLFLAASHPDLRFLDAGGSGMTLKALATNTMLLHLNLARSNITRLDTMRFVNMYHLDLSYNLITRISLLHILACKNLQTLNVAGNPLLNLSGCPMTFFAQNIFTYLSDLSKVYADNYKLCCPAILPTGFNVLDCHAPVDEVSSCQGLLKSGLYRVALAVLTLLIVLGNLSSFVYRVVISRDKNRTSFGLFVTNLCVSDFLMGVYSAIIGVADRVYLEDYLWSDVTWRNSTFCKMAGFLSLLSNEVSAFIICLVTVDRFLVTRFPLSHHLHFSLRSARTACAVVWTAGVLLASVPLLPVTSHWEFYSQTGICIPLPITRKRFDGHSYSYGILIILNLVLFVLIAVGQMSIYWSVRGNSMAASDTTQKSRDLVIGRRLITVAVSDFLCWFPVGLLGLLASAGHPIPGEANVAIAIFVLPLNSALNPFLYTVNVIMERSQKARELRLQKILLARLKGSKVLEGMYSKEEGKRFLRKIMISGVLTHEDVLQITSSAADEQRNG